MPRRAPLALAALALVALVAGALLLTIGGGARSVPATGAPAQKEQLMLLTSLPIVFAERLTLDPPPSPVLEALQSRYQVVPINLADAQTLEGNDLLLMAQPQAQPAEVLVELDEWVRRGGRVLLLGDPLLQWPSERPLGDMLRPPLSFADTGLLAHWGLRMRAADSAGPVSRSTDAGEIRTSAPGALIPTKSNCEVTAAGLIARCRIGKGEATVIADADFLDVDSIEGVNRDSNLGLLLKELERLEQ